MKHDIRTDALRNFLCQHSVNRVVLLELNMLLVEL